MTRTEGGSCQFCNHPLQIQRDTIGKKKFICTNNKCPAQQLTHIETRLEAIEKLLEIKHSAEEEIISITPEVPIIPETELEPVITLIRTLPDLSLEEGKFCYYTLIEKLGGSRYKLNILLERTANSEYASPRLLLRWAILMAYSGKAFMAAQRILSEKGYLPQSSISKNLEIIIDRSNSVLTGEQFKIDPIEFYSHLLNWGKREGLSGKTLNTLKIKLGLITPLIEEKKPEKITTLPLVSTEEMTPSQTINQSLEPYQQPLKSWIDRFRPKKGWEFTIGANWLRWVGIGIILFALLLLVVWSASQLKLTADEIALLTFVGLFLSGAFFHFLSFYLLRLKERSLYIQPIAISLAFLSLGIYYIALFTLRFHPSSPFHGVEALYLILCFLLILTTCGTGWVHDSSILFMEGFLFTLWLFWHVPSQIFVNELVFPVDILWIGYVVSIVVFLGIGYLRKDILLSIGIQLMSLSLIFLPNSSIIFSTHSIIEEIPDINTTIILLFIISLVNWIIAFRFPFDTPPQSYEIINRYHLSIASITPILASFFLLTFKMISGVAFIPYLVIFTTLFLGLSYFQKDLGVSFSLVFLIQLLWLISVGFMDDITFYESIPEINGTLVILLSLTFSFWLIAYKFPSDQIATRFWNFIDRKHLSVVAIGPIFVSFILSRFNYIVSDIFIIYLVLFCILWSTNRSLTFNIPDVPLKNISLLDIVIYSSASLFLITIILNTSENTFGAILGFMAFPLLIVFNQSLSNMSFRLQEIKEIYPVIDCLFVAIIFLFMAWKEKFSQLGVWISSNLLDWGLTFLDFLDLNYGHTWAFMGFIWTIIITIISIRMFQTHIIQSLPRFILVLSPPSVLFVYIRILHRTNPILLVFVIVGYLELIILWFLFTSKDEIGRTDLLMFIPSIALLQILGNMVLTITISEWNIVSTFLVNFLLPFSLGILSIVRRHLYHLYDSYLVISVSIFTLFQFTYLNSSQQGNEAWFLEFLFLACTLAYIFTRIYFNKTKLSSISTSHSILKSIFPYSTFSNKDIIGGNLLLLCFLGLMNNTLCFVFFPTDLSPTIVFLIFDSMAVLPMAFALTLFGIDSRVATANTFTIYGIGLILRLPMLTSYFADYNFHLFIGIVIQLILHGLLIRLSKSPILSSSITKWEFKFEGRKTWTQDSFRMMALINPVCFYFFTSQLALRIRERFKIQIVLPIMILSIVIAIYFVIETRLIDHSIINDSGLLSSILIAWIFTASLLEFIYFTTAATAFLSILYGFWVYRREWRILGILIIAFSLVYSAFYIAQISDNLVKILGFGILGVFSVVIAFIYSKFAKRFIEEDVQKINAQEKPSTS